MNEPGWVTHFKKQIMFIWLAMGLFLIIVQVNAQGRYYIEGKLQKQIEDVKNHVDDEFRLYARKNDFESRMNKIMPACFKERE